MSGTKNKIEDLRNHLFETLEALKDGEKPMEIDRARAIATVAKEIIESAKVEVDYLRVTGNSAGSGFIPADRQLPAPGPSRQESGEAHETKRPGSSVKNRSRKWSAG